MIVNPLGVYPHRNGRSATALQAEPGEAHTLFGENVSQKCSRFENEPSVID